ncbi:MAG: S8 family serine peptidase [Bacteroidota bacterium]
MNKSLLFAVSLLFLITIDLFSGEYLSNILVVKFVDSVQIEKIIENVSPYNLTINSLLGNVTFEPAFNQKLIEFGLRKYSNYFRTDYQNRLQSLRRVFIVKYTNEIDPIVASRKLHNLGIFEYVEPFYIHKIDSATNDPYFGNQYYLRQIKALEAWNLIDSTADTVVVGIVDTGVDIDHEDLRKNIFINYGEVGIDSSGKFKSLNGIDDDGNGYVDDVFGWDFCGTDGQKPDNDPRPGNGHGTHVAGIVGAVHNNEIGVAGIVPKVKILPVKTADDNPFNTFISKGYEGILYAGIMGAKVINCSWGSETGSELENDVIRTVNSMGVCVVAAAGNDGKYSDFAPASLNGVLSVAAVDSNDIKAGFSNYSGRVGVSAPGVKILSTTPANSYASWDGTSMASPVASGVVALARQKFPNLNYEQIYELVKRQSDNIDSLNPNYVGLIGSGRVNAQRTLDCNPDTIRSIILTSYKVFDFDGDNLLVPNDTIKLFLAFKNVFSDLKNVYVEIPDNSQNIASILKNRLMVGDVPILTTIEPKDSIVFILSSNLPYDYSLKIPIYVYDSIGFVARFYIEFQVNPTYRTMSFNNISVTFNSRGNIGFNDYPQNKQGVGFIYKSKPNVLFEGGLLVGYDRLHVYDVVRSSNQNRQSGNFVEENIFSISYDSEKKSYIGKCSFITKPDSLSRSDVYVNCEVLQSVGVDDSNLVFISYWVKNNSLIDWDSLFVGLFFDWDLGISGQNDYCVYDLDFDFGYAYNKDNDTLPLVGVKVLNDSPINFYAIDNDGRGEDSVGIYDGFSKYEKWMMLTGGIKRKSSRATDASMVISAGPLRVEKDSTTKVHFVLFAEQNILSLRKTSINAESLAYKLSLTNKPKERKISPVDITIFPNPSSDDFIIRISFLEISPVEITVYDNSGRFVRKFSYEKNVPWTIEQKLGLGGVGSGNYFVLVKTMFGDRHFLITKVK